MILKIQDLSKSLNCLKLVYLHISVVWFTKIYCGCHLALTDDVLCCPLVVHRLRWNILVRLVEMNISCSLGLLKYCTSKMLFTL